MKSKTRFLVLALLFLFLASSRATTFYVNVSNPTPVAPFNSWSTAATNIQDAVDVASAGDVISVTNGVYEHGGRSVYGLLTNRVCVTNAVTVQSVNGPEVTLISGYVPGFTNADSAIRCVYLGPAAVLSGFTLTHGATRTRGIAEADREGGGVYCYINAHVSNCVIVANHARLLGGGAFSGQIYNSRLEYNSSGSNGGGAANSFLKNCIVTNNRAFFYSPDMYLCTGPSSPMHANFVRLNGGEARPVIRSNAGPMQILTADNVIVTSAAPSVVAPDDNYFQTSYKNEPQFIVQTILTECAQQLYFAKEHRSPDPNASFVHLTQAKNSSVENPVFDIDISIAPGLPVLKTNLIVNGPIWSPELYLGVARQIASVIGLAAVQSNGSNISILDQLSDGNAITIERENERISNQLKESPADASLHEQAAFLLGAFALREYSTFFHDIRIPLCRMTAHLVVAQQLSVTGRPGTTGQIANVMLLTLMNNQADAMAGLGSISEIGPAGKWVRTLKAMNTGDYRVITGLDKATPVERMAWFHACGSSLGWITYAWPRLSESERTNLNFIRIANGSGYSVEIGHFLMATSIPLELREIMGVYETSHRQKLERNHLIDALNELPGNTVSSSSNSIQVAVIDWGLWAVFFQSQLGQAINENHNFLRSQWDVPEEANKFMMECDGLFNGLRIYPFVQVLMTGGKSRDNKAIIERGMKVVKTTPYLLPPGCWKQLNYAMPYNENDFACKHAYVWLNYGPPPGTAYDCGARLRFLDMMDPSQAGSMQKRYKLHDLAPYDLFITGNILEIKYQNGPFDAVEAFVRPLMPYSSEALTAVSAFGHPPDAQHLEILKKSVEINPGYYHSLGDYYAAHDQKDNAAECYEKVREISDAVSAASVAGWLSQYYLGKSETNKAEAIVNEAAETYSADGLEAKAAFLEAVGKYDDAYQWYLKIDDRYDDMEPLAAFVARYKQSTGDDRFNGPLRLRMLNKCFPRGIEHVSLKDFFTAPVDGVTPGRTTELMRNADLRSGDVIVALDGVRIHNSIQFNFICNGKQGEMDLIVWQKDKYAEIKCNPPGRRFGVPIKNYGQQN